MSATRAFAGTTPLQPGLSLLEASAGTGKTYQIANLVVRLVTEPDPPLRMGEILIVTFTRAATGELVDRVRRRLAEAVRVHRRCLAEPALPPAQATADESLRHLVGAARAAGRLPRHLELLERAQEEFDQALISTMHGFCQRMLRQNAFESLVDFDLELVEDQGALIEEIVDDYLSREVNTASPARRAFLTGTCGFSRASLGKLAQTAVGDPDLEVDPDPGGAPPAPPAERLAAFADWWEQRGMAEIATAMERADASGDLVPAKGNRSQTTYRAVRAAKEAAVLLAWARGVLAGTEHGACPNASYWDAASLRRHSPGPRTWHHPHLDRVRRALFPEQEEAAHERARVVAWFRRTLHERHREQRSMNFQDLLRLLAGQLARPDRAEPLRGAIAAGFRAALIDEFQDTDPAQWTIFGTLFGAGQHYLYLIGDPKQAIYGFRGANVNVYLQAKAAAGERWSMSTNFRSDARLLAALNPLLAAPCPPDAPPPPDLEREGLFGLHGIAYEPVAADAGRAPAVRLIPAPAGDAGPPGAMAPLQIRFLDRRSDPTLLDDGDDEAPLTTAALGALLPRLVAADVAALLERGQRIHDRGTCAFRRLDPGDIAVLVRTNVQARAVQAALLEAGVPCVLPGADSVLASDEARDLRLWLEAVQSPGSDSKARAAVTTPIFGVSARALRALDHPGGGKDGAWWDTWLGQLVAWHGTIEQSGVLRAFRAAMQERGVRTRLLGWPDGERRLTNLLHLLELLHAAEVQEHLGLGGLIRWLAAQRRSARADAETGELRLERDDEAVRILTLHKAKGLQFPVVFLPYHWSAARGGRDAFVVSRQAGSPARVLDVHTDDSSEPRRTRLDRSRREAWQEDLRLLYVALTRAEQRVVLYTGHVKGMETSAVATLLHAFPPGTAPGAVGDRLEAARTRVPGLGAGALWTDLLALAARIGEAPPHGPGVQVSRCDPVLGAPRWTRPGVEDGAAVALEARAFTRRDAAGRPLGLDHTWQRASYTSITKSRSHQRDEAIERAADALGLHEQPETGGQDDDPDAGTEQGETLALEPAAVARLRAALPTDDVAAAEVPLATFPPGPDAGTFLHTVFEDLDFELFAHAAGDEEAERTAREEILRIVAARGALGGHDTQRVRALLAGGLPAVLRTPLGGDPGSVRLADIPRGRRLDELRFTLPIAGGDEHRRRDIDGRTRFSDPVSGRDFGEAFRLGRGDPALRDAYIEKLACGWENGRFAGYLTGSIDLVFATPVARQSDPQRFWIVDYKSNRVDHLREGRTVRGHFCRTWLLHEMEHHDYIVQAYLYSLAVVRFLRQRLPRAGDPFALLGGALYLFVRGMAGPERPPDGDHPYGVFALRPHRAVLERLDALFSAESPSGGGQ